MRVKETQSKTGKGETIYEVRLGFNEIRAIHDLCKDALKRTPEAIEIMSFRRRLNNIQKILGKVVKERLSSGTLK